MAPNILGRSIGGTRRALFGLAFGATVMTRRTGLAQSTDSQQQNQAMDEDGLQDRGAPTGRTGAATRGAGSVDGGLTLDLVAPLRGVGLTLVDQPELCYVLSDRTVQPGRLTISTPGRARPVADFALPHAQSPGLAIVRLRDHGIRLAPNLLCVWSVTLALDPRAPSKDLVGSALIQYRPNGLVLAAADREALPQHRVAALARAGYWYDAVAVAERSRDSDHGAALATLFREAELPVAASSGTGSAQ